MVFCRSMKSLHSNGKTTSPETVSPIGLQAPGGGISSFAEDCAGAGLGSAGLLVCARAAPLIPVRRMQHSAPAWRAKVASREARREAPREARRGNKCFIGSLNCPGLGPTRLLGKSMLGKSMIMQIYD